MQMWSFGLRSKIAHIYAKPGYPKHYPNTVVAGYSVAMHAKYEAMQWTIDDNPFRTRYFCWLDVGLFRDLSGRDENSTRMSIHLPPGFRNDSVAYTEVFARDKRSSVSTIINNNQVWVCGCFFIAEASVMRRWTDEYKVRINFVMCLVLPVVKVGQDPPGLDPGSSFLGPGSSKMSPGS